ncbi:MAG: DUF1499 domain-containing protein [Alphaproteobacteria bacterium]|nr:MAG: DUF1499 domain-containing protein [Alphaproteobacteria bacterium]
MTLLKIALVLLAFVALAGLWVRLAPLPAERLTARPGPMEPGVHPLTGGVKVVRPLADLPEGAFERLCAIAAATPRTRQVGEDPCAFVTRSRLWGFPDIAVIWVQDGNLHIHSHLVFGRSDLGVNAARVARWLDRLEAGS